MKLRSLVSLALIAFIVMCLAITVTCVEWIRLPVESDCGSVRTTVLQ
jgi:hypothetical protein